MKFSNSYEDAKRAEAYSKLQFAGTYFLAYRDLPEIIREFVQGKNALDFGCGTGRSTRFLKSLGFHTVGIDISEEMVNIAKKLDPAGEYRVISDGDFSCCTAHSFDLVLSAFTFDNIPTLEKKVALFTGLAGLLKKTGTMINLVSSPEIYTHEWTSFSTKDFPENVQAKTGDVVSIITTDFEDRRPCFDIFWPDADYQHVYQQVRLKAVKTHRPLARGDEPYHWVNETRIAPWVIYVLKKEYRKS
jgi:ubiquinone/menaquinone biosynthesis C-methylase UbiE